MLMRFLIDAVSDDPEMTKVAESAFRSYIRAYAAHPRSVRCVKGGTVCW